MNQYNNKKNIYKKSLTCYNHFLHSLTIPVFFFNVSSTSSIISIPSSPFSIDLAIKKSIKVNGECFVGFYVSTKTSITELTLLDS